MKNPVKFCTKKHLFNLLQLNNKMTLRYIRQNLKSNLENTSMSRAKNQEQSLAKIPPKFKQHGMLTVMEIESSKVCLSKIIPRL